MRGKLVQIFAASKMSLRHLILFDDVLHTQGINDLELAAMKDYPGREYAL